MTAEQAREMFSAAHEGELSAQERAEFEAALLADAALADEYARFGQMMSATQSLRMRDTPTPNLLPKVQARIRRRSRGRFYRDRFSERGGPSSMLPVLAGGVMLLILGALWVMAQHL